LKTKFWKKISVSKFLKINHKKPFVKVWNEKKNQEIEKFV
jgi:uncharacterized protein YxeA